VAGTDQIPLLWHLKPSHYNEKARWALDYKGIPHRRVSPAPGAHMAIALVLTRRVVTFPVLQIDGRAIGDSTRIISALEERFPEPPLYPADPAERRRALELEEFFDEYLGPDARRVAFFEVLRDQEFMRANRDAGLPAFPGLVRLRYGLTEDAAAQSRLKVRAAMDLIEDLLDGGDHLVGDEFTVADLTGAALLAPLLGPPGLPYRDPSRSLPESFERVADELRSLPAGAWVLRTYERYRPASAEAGAG
jgi:glutathione S-transferase